MTMLTDTVKIGMGVKMSNNSRAEYYKKWREANKERRKAYKKKYYEENKEAIKKQQKDYRDNKKVDSPAKE